MRNVKIALEARSLPLYAVSYKSGRKTLEIQAFDGVLTISTQYDYDRRPLDLTCEIKEGDKIEAIFLNYRIELYINGAIIDEEWPCGERLFDIDDEFVGNADSSDPFGHIKHKKNRRPPARPPIFFRIVSHLRRSCRS